MKYLLIHIILVFTLINCESISDSTGKKNITSKETNSPYPLFFKTLNIPRFTDTILVQNKTRIFGCGTEALEYNDKLKKSGLDVFYEKFGSVLSNRNLIENFAKANNAKVLWVTRGIEGETMHLEEESLHRDTVLETRLFNDKDYVVFSEEPISLDCVHVKIKITQLLQKDVTEITSTLTLKNKKWVYSSKDSVANSVKNTKQ